MSALLPCPFCGKRKLTYTIDGGDGADLYSVSCEFCGTTGPLDFEKSGAAEKWNTRSDEVRAAPGHQAVAADADIEWTI